MACQANPDCDCVVQCVSEMGIGAQDMCVTEVCGLDAPPVEAGALQTCVATGGCLPVCV